MPVNSGNLVLRIHYWDVEIALREVGDSEPHDSGRSAGGFMQTVSLTRCELLQVSNYLYLSSVGLLDISEGD